MVNFERLKQDLSEFHLLKHDFYKILWNNGLLSRQDLKYYAQQYYFIEENFLQCLQKSGKLYSDYKEVADIVHENMQDETGNFGKKESHLQLWEKFAKFCGATHDDIHTNNEQHEKVSELIDKVNELTEKSVASAVGVAYAYEWQIPEIAQSKIEGLMKYYDAKDKGELDFFKEHKTADVWHTEQWEKLVSKFDAVEMKEFQQASTETMKLLLGFLDGVMDARGLSCDGHITIN